MSLHGPLYRGWEVAVVCASGPSFSPAQAAIVVEARRRGLCNVVAINRQYETVPNADVLYATDGAFWDVYLPDIYRAGFQGELWTQHEGAAKRHGLRHVKAIPGDRLPPEPDWITQGGNSGHAGIQLTARFGATRIVLCGFDLCRPADGKKHNHADHPAPLGNGNPVSWLPRFTPLAHDLQAAGIQVVNCSPGTALTVFPRATIQEALGYL